MIMGCDGLLLLVFIRIYLKYCILYINMVIIGIGIVLLVVLFLLDIFGELILMGMLIVFVVVCVGVLILCCI